MKPLRTCPDCEAPVEKGRTFCRPCLALRKAAQKKAWAEVNRPRKAAA